MTPPAQPTPENTAPVKESFTPPTKFGGFTLSRDYYVWLGWTGSEAIVRSAYAQKIGANSPPIVFEPDEGFTAGFPVLAGDWLVLPQFATADRDQYVIRAKNLVSNEVIQIAERSTGGHRLGLAASGNKLVWIEGNWVEMETSWSKMLVYDFTSGETAVLRSLKFPDNLERVSISGSTVAYTQFTTEEHPQGRTFRSDVFVLDLETGAAEQLSDSGQAWSVHLYQDYVVWKEASDMSDFGDVILYARNTGEARRITQDGTALGITDPSVGDGFVTWQQRLGPRHIPVYSICDAKLTKLEAGKDVVAPVAQGSAVVWIKTGDTGNIPEWVGLPSCD